MNRNRIGSLEVSAVGLTGATKAEQVISDAAAADWQLGAEDLAAIEVIAAHEAEIEDLEDLR